MKILLWIILIAVVLLGLRLLNVAKARQRTDFMIASMPRRVRCAVGSVPGKSGVRNLVHRPQTWEGQIPHSLQAARHYLSRETYRVMQRGDRQHQRRARDCCEHLHEAPRIV